MNKALKSQKNELILAQPLNSPPENIYAMCLAIPGKIVSITGQLDEVFRTAKVSFGGITKEVNLSMVPEANVGDYVLVHVGVAINKVDEQEAHKTLEYLSLMGEMAELESETDKKSES
jgi:hydrogenase expression/formation protein HypC